MDTGSLLDVRAASRSLSSCAPARSTKNLETDMIMTASTADCSAYGNEHGCDETDYETSYERRYTAAKILTKKILILDRLMEFVLNSACNFVVTTISKMSA